LLKHGPGQPSSPRASRICAGIFDLDELRARLDELEHISATPDFWDDQERAQRLMKERNSVAEAVEGADQMLRASDDLAELLELAELEDDESLLPELSAQLEALETRLDRIEFERMMTSPNDRNNAILQINAGAGGTESCDWASMLLRMYTRWGERQGFKLTLHDVQPGDEAGIKSATVQLDGPWAFGFLKAENGVHRLVRISPFDSNKRRHTSFASVFVVPEEDDEFDIDINEADLRVDTYRASGAGGQHVNRTDSAVRITHEPTGIVVQCQAERSQHKNRSTAMKMLRARLADLARKERNEERDAIEAAKKGINFGSQIRSYVLQPYQMVKDLRSAHETSKTDDVLDGDLDGFIKAYLMMDGSESTTAADLD
jgi:peptide chain release factor 2